MVRITEGKTESLADIANKHWNKINPYSVPKKRYWDQSLNQRITDKKELHEAAGRISEASFYGELMINDFQLVKDIIYCQPSGFNTLITKIETLHSKYSLASSSSNENQFGHELLYDIFRYKQWRESKSSLQLLEWLGIEVCPYCNLGLVWQDTVRNLAVVSYDHFFDKSTYPYLSLSFYNLIPACQPCNQIYKHSRPFNIDSHLHPYLDYYNRQNTFNHNYTDDDTPYEVNIITIPGDLRSPLFNTDLGLNVRCNVTNVKKMARAVYKITQRYPLSTKQKLVSDWGLVDLNEVEENICKEEDIPFKEAAILNHQYGKLKRDFALKGNIIDRNNNLL